MPVANQTTAFVNEDFATSGLLGTSLMDNDPEPRVRPGTSVPLTNNKKAVYVKAHAAIAAGAAVAVAAVAGLPTTAAGAGYAPVVALTNGYYGWVVSTAAMV